MEMQNIDLTQLKGAVFSEDGKHRYALWRVWSDYRKPLMFIGLNPSKADRVQDDPTITRMIRRADMNGYGGLLVGNLYSYVSTDPRILLTTQGCYTPETDHYLKLMSRMAETVLCGWGSFKPVEKRAQDVLAFLPVPYCVGVNADGQPQHPLYVGYDIPIGRYHPKVEASK